MSLPPKWTDVYPHGTKQGDEEMAFFAALARTNWAWRSTAALVKESGLSRERVEEILSKYLNHKPPLIYMSETKDEHWAYWQRVPNLVGKNSSIKQKDQTHRIDQHSNQSFSSQVIIVADNQPLP